MARPSKGPRVRLQVNVEPELAEVIRGSGESDQEWLLEAIRVRLGRMAKGTEPAARVVNLPRQQGATAAQSRSGRAAAQAQLLGPEELAERRKKVAEAQRRMR